MEWRNNTMYHQTMGSSQKGKEIKHEKKNKMQGFW